MTVSSGTLLHACPVSEDIYQYLLRHSNHSQMDKSASMQMTSFVLAQMQHEQEEDFDLLDDAFLLGDDPNMPGAVTTQERALGPAEGLGLDSFIEGK